MLPIPSPILRVYKRLVETGRPGTADRWALWSHVTCFDIRKVSDFAPFRRVPPKMAAIKCNHHLCDQPHLSHL